MRFRHLLPAACAVMVLISSGCGDDSSGPSDGGDTTPPPPPQGDVLVKSDFFDPAALTVTTGDNVVWTWDSDGDPHSVTFDDESDDSGIQTEGSFEHTFAAAGTFPYHCEVHPTTMRGTITVTDAGETGGDTGGGDTGGGDMGGGGGGTGY